MSENRFYTEWDKEWFADARNRRRSVDHRGVFAQERDRIVFSTAFRRLQAKTQVFQAGEYDFYRTRLTHSLEVATLAKSIVAHVTATTAVFGEDFRPDADLVEAVCLAHDIGHPPFGHAGERALNAWMEPYGGFEGNAQSLRILTRTIYHWSDGRGGMSPSRALVDGILKYKRLHKERAGASHHFLYDDQTGLLKFCFGTSALARRLPKGMPVNAFRSLECQIMDAADDIAYSCCDVVDGARARLLSLERLRPWREKHRARLSPAQEARLDRLIARIEDGHLGASMSNAIGTFIAACRIEETSGFMSDRTNRYRYRLAMEPAAREEIALLKELGRTFVYGAPELQQIEYKGGQLLRRMMASLEEIYLAPGQPRLKLVPGELHEAVAAERTKAARARILCDFVSGMTDAYAIRMYKRLSDPDYSPISEIY